MHLYEPISVWLTIVFTLTTIHTSFSISLLSTCQNIYRHLPVFLIILTKWGNILQINKHAQKVAQYGHDDVFFLSRPVYALSKLYFLSKIGNKLFSSKYAQMVINTSAATCI